MVSMGRTNRPEGKSASIAVVKAIAEAEGVEPEDLDFALYDVVDPDALDALSTGAYCEITFRAGNYDVTVTSGRDDESRPSVSVDRI